MLVTEEEAKKRWCPMARVNAGPGFNRNSVGEPSRSALCIASECMAWRKDQNSEYDTQGNLRGFCGLSGNPTAGASQ